MSIHHLLRDLELLPPQNPTDRIAVGTPSAEMARVAQAVDDALSEVAMRVHDNELQVLSAVTMGLHHLADQLQDTSARERADHLAALLARTIADLRQHLMGAPPTPRLPLSRRLTAAVDDLRLTNGPDLLLRLPGEVDCITDVSLQDDIVAVLREANSNAIRHARATTVLSLVQVDVGRVRISVADNGVGIDAAPRRSGLRNMDRRARVRGGEFTVAPRPDGGTRVEWVVPLRRIGDVSARTSE